MDYSNVPTPALILDMNIVQRNCNNMLESAKAFGVQLRPHFKTAKEASIADLQTGGSKLGLVVSTLAEAEYLAVNKFDDILYGVGMTPDKIKRFCDLSHRLSELHCMVDNEAILDIILKQEMNSNRRWSIFIDVDNGYHRSGAFNETLILTLAKRIHSSPNATLKGIYIHCGNSYYAKSKTDIKKIGREAAEAVLDIVNRLKENDIECDTYGIGSTPSCSVPDESLSRITEWHPGNYVFYDLMQEKLGSCSRDDIACYVLTRVKGHYSDGGHRIGVDCGWTALTTQGFGEIQKGGFAAIDGHPELRLSSMSQEHGIITAADGADIDFSKYPVGSCLKILPYHSCATCCMHPTYYILDDKLEIQQRLHPVKGW